MAKTIQKIIKFSKGEINPLLNERNDIDILNNSASYIKNYIPTIFGGIKTRFGTEHILELTDFKIYTKNIPFIERLDNSWELNFDSDGSEYLNINIFCVGEEELFNFLEFQIYNSNNQLIYSKNFEGQKTLFLKDIPINGNENYKITTNNKNVLFSFSGSAYKKQSIENLNNLKIVPFVYSLNDYYLIILSNNIIYIIKDDIIKDFIELDDDLSFDNLEIVKYSQYENMICFTESTKKPRLLQREIKFNDNTNKKEIWSFAFMNLINISYRCFDKEITIERYDKITPSNISGVISISGSNFNSSMVGQIIDGNGGRVRITEYVNENKLYGYTIIPFYTDGAIDKWKYISGFEISLSNKRGWPNSCLFYQNRLFFGGSKSRPLTIWGSRVDNFNDFNNIGNYSNDSINIDIASTDYSQIINLFSARGLTIFTETAEFLINENSLTPNNITVTQVSNIGSNRKTEPIQINDEIIFLESKGRNIYNFNIYSSYDYKQSATTITMSLLNNNIIKKPINISSSFNSNWTDGNFIYLVNEDGTITIDNYLVEQNINSFSRIEAENIYFYDVINLAEDTYFLVKSNNKIHLLKLNNNLKTDLTIKRYIIENTNIIDNLDYFNNFNVRVYFYDKENKLINLGIFKVENNKIRLLEELENGTTIYIGIDIYCKLVSNNIQINSNSYNIKKRISQAIITTTNKTENITFNNKSSKPYIRDNDKIYKILNTSNYDIQTRFDIKSTFDYLEIKSVILLLNYGKY